MSTITISSDRTAYTGRLGPIMPITHLVQRFLAGEPRAEDAECLALVMLTCALRAEGRFALLRDEDTIHVVVTHSGQAAARAYHSRLVSEYGPLLGEFTTEWDTELGEPDGEEPNTYACFPRHGTTATAGA